jgi:tetratricopeptide (TPR) repeat protein
MLKDYYNVLGLGPNATETEIRNAYRRLAKEYHPDKSFTMDHPILSSVQFDEINEAYHVLSDKKRRQNYDHIRSDMTKALSDTNDAKTIQAENCFRNGLKALKEGDPKQAMGFLEWAVKYSPNKPIYHSKLGLAMALAGEDLEKAQASCERAIEMEIFNAAHYVDLAEVYAHAGLNEKAREKLKEALRWNPNSKLAAERLKEIQPKGLLGKLFGKK